MSGSWVLATDTSCEPASLTTVGSLYDAAQIGSESLTKPFCVVWLVMNLMYCHASFGCLLPVVIMTGWPPLQPGAFPPGPAGVCRIITLSLATVLCAGSSTAASW